MALTHGYVIGQLITSKGDGDDADRLPDVVGASGVTVKFAPAQQQYVTDNPPRMVASEPVTAVTMADGTLTGDIGPDGTPKVDAAAGLWLVAGQYTVTFSGGKYKSFTITVTTAHTEATPLDLALAVGYTPMPGTQVSTVKLPQGAAEGQVVGWTADGVAWVDQAGGTGDGTQGPKGDPGDDGADGVDGASAYEVAVAEGYVGTESAWLASLVGPEGPEGPQGPKGDTGDTGPQGEPGVDGADGAQGIQGPKGDTGDTGPKGDAGDPATVNLTTIPAGSTLAVVYNGTSWPARPTARTDIIVHWLDFTGNAPVPAGGIENLDLVFQDGGA